MKKNVKNLLLLLGLFCVCLAFSLILGFAGQNAIEDTPVRKKEIAGVSVNTVSVLDVNGVMRMTAFNYLPNDFAELSETVSNANGGAPARRGTYRFYLDTLSMEEWAESGRLEHLLRPDGSWHLTMYLPPVFSACSVYVQYENQAYLGEIDRYNIGYYVNFSSPSEFDETVMHRTATQPLFLDLSVSAESKYSRECAVTIHYEADNENFIGLSGGILIGEDGAVRRAVAQNRSMLLIGAIIGAATLLIFLFICILKCSRAFVPQLLFAVGVFLMLFSTYLLFGFSAAPYFVLALRRLSVALILASATLYLPKRAGWFPVLYAAVAVAAVAGVLAFLSPFCNGAYTAVCIAYTVLAAVCIAAVLGFTAFDVYRGRQLGLRLNCMIAAALVLAALFLGASFPLLVFSPAFWLCMGMLAVTLVLGFREFISAEIRNRYLTANLEQEVERQTQSLQEVLAERDKILLYVSHDMKKTVSSMGGALSDLRHCISAPEQAAKVDDLLQKNAELKKDFADLGKYGRQNYIAEQSEVLNVSALVQKVAADLRPDCEANGILLTVSLPEKLNVYAKRAALESVIFNLILNAIEHALCTHLSVTAIRRKGMCRLEIADDGRGVATDKNIFEPFVSGDASEDNLGLGLFLAQSAVRAMHGELTYERRDGITVFSATLPLA